MKLVLALAVLATSAASVAASRDIYDIMYLPSAGTTYGFTTGNYQKISVDGAGTDDSEIKGYTIEQTIGHSFSDRLSVQGVIDYAAIENDPDTGSTTDSSKGVSDPTISARFRVMDEDFRWDIIGGATLSLMDKKVDVNSNGDADFDNHQGGHSFFIGTQFGGKTDTFQWALTAQLTHYLESETEVDSSAGNRTFDQDSYNKVLVRGDILNKLGEKSLLRSHLEVNFYHDYQIDDLRDYEIGTEYQHLMSQDLLLRAGVDYAIAEIPSGYFDTFTGWRFTVGANYQF
jgi:hypothetical protein